MDNAAAPPNKRNSGGAATDSRAADPIDPRTEELPEPVVAPVGHGDRSNGSHDNGASASGLGDEATTATGGDGNGASGSGKARAQRRPRWRSASATPQPPAESVIPVEDAAALHTAAASPEPDTLPAPAISAAPTTHVPPPALLPPIRTAPHPADRPIVRKVLRPPEAPGLVPAPVVTPVHRAPSTGQPQTDEQQTGEPTGVLAPPPVVLFDDALLTTESPAVRRIARPAVTFKRRSTRPRVRRVTRVVRHIDTWSVFKVALVFSVFIYAVSLTAGVLLWHVAVDTGTVDNIEKFFEGFGWTTFEFKGGEIYHSAWVGGMFVAIGLTGLAVLMATLFNLITDLVGGIRVSVLEEEVLARRDRTPVVTMVEEPAEDAPFDPSRDANPAPSEPG